MGLRHMFKKIISSIMALAIMASIGTTVMAEEVGETNSKYTIAFNDGARINDLESFPPDIMINEFVICDNVNANEYLSGYVNYEHLERAAMLNDFKIRYLGLLNDAQKNMRSESDISADLTTRISRTTSDNDYILKSVTAELSKRQLELVSALPIVGDAYKLQIDHSTGQEVNISQRTSSWTPSSGSAVAMQSSSYSDATYLELNFQWNSSTLIANLNDRNDRTFEGEIVFYNYDGKGMSTKYGNYAYSTNLPSNYLDTQFNYGDTSEPNFSIGCSDASQLQANKNYFWICYGNRNSSGSQAKVNFQKGHRAWNPSNSTWNIFADETYKAVAFTSWNTSNNSMVTF